MNTSALYHAVWTAEHLDAVGKLLWSETKKNALTINGGRLLLDLAFLGQTLPSQYPFYVRLSNQPQGSPVSPTTGLASVRGEPSTSGLGYSMVGLTRDSSGFISLTQPSQGLPWVLQSQQVSWTGVGDGFTVNTAFLATSTASNGDGTCPEETYTPGSISVMAAYLTLSTPRYVKADEILRFSFTIDLQSA